MRLKKINKKYEELVNDFIELSDKLNVKIVHDKGILTEIFACYLAIILLLLINISHWNNV